MGFRVLQLILFALFNSLSVSGKRVSWSLTQLSRLPKRFTSLDVDMEQIRLQYFPMKLGGTNYG